MMDQTIIIEAEGITKGPTKRFVRNKDVPLDLEIMRERIVSARVMNGLSAVDAAKLLGYANSTQLSMLEGGQRKVPSDWKFLKNMSQAYSVSVDYLIGISPNPERDAVTSQHFAIMRGFEQLQQLQAATMTTAFVRYAADGAASHELESLCKAAETMRFAVQVLRDRCPGFNDLRGGATLLASAAALDDAIGPVRLTLNRKKSNEQTLIDIASGKQGPLSYLMEKHKDNAETQPC